MRHLYRCPVRWADLDLLGHVNNVTYVDYLQEARVDMFRTHGQETRGDDPAEGTVVVRHEVTYVSSLTSTAAPVAIECWVTEVRAASFTVAYEVFTEPEPGGERAVHLRARTVLTPYVFDTARPRRLRDSERAWLSRLLEPDEPVRAPRAPAVVEVPGGHYPVHVRFSDVDVYGHVNNVKYFEYLQEARIRLLVDRGRELGDGYHFVVAQSDVDYRRPLLFRREPYDLRTWVAHLGRTSVVFESVIRDGDHEGAEVLARARVVGVCLDSATGRPAPVPGHLRELAGAP